MLYNNRMMTIETFFREHPKTAIAFSGGVDSAYLLYEAVRNGADVHAYYVNAQFQPAFELRDARKLAAQVGAKMTVIEKDVLAVPEVRANPEDRCYYCKQSIFGTILAKAGEDGYTEILDGTNASDDASDRPGMRALAEMRVLSPLRICGLTKEEIRRRSKEAGLFTWDKPAYACLATRIPTGTEITKEALWRTEQAENYLFEQGYTDFRVRTTKEDSALVQVPSAQTARIKEEWQQIEQKLLTWYPEVLLDPNPR